MIVVGLLLSVLVTATASADKSNPSNASRYYSSPKQYENPDPLGSDAEQLSKDMGITPEEVKTVLERQPSVGQLQSAMLSKGPASYGGLFVDYSPGYLITILSSPGGGSEVLKAVTELGFGDLAKFITVRETDFTEGALQHAMTQVQDAAGPYLSTIDSDLRTGQVLASGATADDVSQIRAAVDSLQESLTAAGVIISQGKSENADTYGGLHADSSLGNCTTGFSVRRTTDDAHGVTDAAHCPNSFVSISGSAAVFIDGSWGGSQDVQWFDTPYDNDPNKIKDANGGSTRFITSRTDRNEMIIGGGVCHYARNSSGCGLIASTTFNPGPLDNHTYNSTFIRVTGDTVVAGDSGGPWYLQNSAFGTTKGYYGGDPIFMAQNYMSALNLVVKVD
jgi:hypothetical protein